MTVRGRATACSWLESGAAVLGLCGIFCLAVTTPGCDTSSHGSKAESGEDRRASAATLDEGAFRYVVDSFEFPPDLEAHGVLKTYIEGCGVIDHQPASPGRAIQAFDHVIAACPEFAPAYMNRGIAFAMKQRWENAEKDLDRAIELRPEYGFAYCNRGIVQARTGETMAAEADLYRAAELEPAYPDIYWNRAVFRTMIGSTAGAEEDLELAAKLSHP